MADIEFNNYIRVPKIPGYEELLESMQDVAQESTLTEGIEEIEGMISGISLDDVAQQSTLVSGITEIEGMIQGIGLDGVAQQGPNSGATNTAIYEVVEDRFNEFDSDIASQLRQIIG